MASSNRKPANPVEKAAKAGDRGETLRALRDKLAAAIDDPATPPRELATISRQLTLVLREIDALPTTTEVTPLDQITQRRNARRRRATG